MPFALITAGLILVVTGAKDTYQAMGQYLIADFTGAGNFIYWVIALIVIGSIGYIPDFRGFSRLFLGLVVIVFIVSNNGVFNQFMAALRQGPIAPQQTQVATPVAIPIQQTGGTSGSSGSSAFGTAANVASTGFKLLSMFGL